MLTYNYMRKKKEKKIMAKTQLQFLYYSEKGTSPLIPHVMQFVFYKHTHVPY